VSDSIEVELNRKAMRSMPAVYNLVANGMRTVDPEVSEQVLVIAKR
jgi:hypothetical protein